MWLAIARHVLFLLKRFYSPGRTGGFVFAEDTRKTTETLLKMFPLFIFILNYSASSTLKPFLIRKIKGITTNTETIAA